MAIYRPTPNLSDTDKRLIRLLSQLLLEHLRIQDTKANLPSNYVPFSDREREELIRLLEQLVIDPDFRAKIFFAEAMAADQATQQAREVFLTGRKRFGRTRALASLHWGSFLARLGKENDVRGASVRRMDYSQFSEMENRLFSNIGIPQPVRDFLHNLIILQRSEVENIRSGEKKVRFSFMSGLVTPLITKLEKNYDHIHSNFVSKLDLAAVCTLVADCGVLFTTRDWGVAGTLSTMAAAAISLKQKDQ